MNRVYMYLSIPVFILTIIYPQCFASQSSRDCTNDLAKDSSSHSLDSPSSHSLEDVNLFLSDGPPEKRRKDSTEEEEEKRRKITETLQRLREQNKHPLPISGKSTSEKGEEKKSDGNDSLALSLPLQPSPRIKKQLRILCIDGGGIRGLIPATILKIIEKKTNTQIKDLFHMVAGTSTGGLLALALSIPVQCQKHNFSSPDSHPAPHWAKDIQKFYLEEGKNVFKKKGFWGRVRSCKGIFSPHYSSQGVDELLAEEFGEATLDSALIDTLVTAYDISHRRAFLFKSWEAKRSEEKNFYASSVAKATSAAPTYFSPVCVQNYPNDPQNSRKESTCLVDGGLAANNPTMCALAEAYHRYGEEVDEYLVLSIGTGAASSFVLSYDEVKKYGSYDWIMGRKGPLLLNIMLNGSAVHEQVLALLTGRKSTEEDPYKLNSKYFRFQPKIPCAIYEKMDTVDPTNLKTLCIEAENYMEGKEARELIRLLLEQPKCEFLSLKPSASSDESDTSLNKDLGG